MTHNPAWHAEYLRLENAESVARAGYRAAEKVISRKRSAAAHAEAEATRDTALEALRIAGKARWDFEMAATTIVNIATLPAAEYFKALWPNRP